MTLNDLTKEELIYFMDGNYFVNMRDVERKVKYFRTEKYSRLACEENQKAIDSLLEYDELFKPYSGGTLNDIPYEVIKKGSEVMKRFEKHSKAAKKFRNQSDSYLKEIFNEEA